MENQNKICESEKSRKQIFVRRIAMLIAFGLLFWQIAGGFPESGTAGIATENSYGPHIVHDFMFCPTLSTGKLIALENALLLGQPLCR